MDEARDAQKPSWYSRLGPYRLIPSRQLLLLGETSHKSSAVGPSSYCDCLCSGMARLVSEEEQMAAAWPGVFVDESNLKVNISHLRRRRWATQN